MLCKIGRITSEGVFVQVVTKEQCCHEPSVGVTLYFALTKGDKPETVHPATEPVCGFGRPEGQRVLRALVEIRDEEQDFEAQRGAT